MDRWACINIFEFPLQVLLNNFPQWREHPVAVVDDDRPSGRIEYVNEHARKKGVRPGHRYAAALSLEPQLRAASVQENDLEDAILAITTHLLLFSPEIEPHAYAPGIYWLNAGGLEKLFQSLEGWGREIGESVAGAGYWHRLVIGYSRFGTYALSKKRNTQDRVSSIHILSDPVQEAVAARTVPLEALGLSSRLLDKVLKLGLEKLDDFLKLPAAGLFERFGKEAYDLHQLADNPDCNTLCPYEPREPVRSRIILDYAESDAVRLTFLIKNELHLLIASLAARCCALMSLRITLRFESKEVDEEILKPAEPTLDERRIIDLIRLRFESSQFSGGVTEIGLIVEDAEATTEQLRLFDQVSTRSSREANRALARVRAAFGNDTVCTVEVTDAHLPEARFRFFPMAHLRHAQCHRKRETPLVRRIYRQVTPFIDPKNTTDRDTFIAGMEMGKVRSITGPDVISGGWWQREVQREYFYVETEQGQILWVFYDRVRRRWRLQGKVE